MEILQCSHIVALSKIRVKRTATFKTYDASANPGKNNNELAPAQTKMEEVCSKQK